MQGVLFVDNTYECISGEKALDLLVKCGATSSDSLARHGHRTRILPQYQGSPIQCQRGRLRSLISRRILAAYEKTTDAHWRPNLLTIHCVRSQIRAGNRRRNPRKIVRSAKRTIPINACNWKELFDGVESVLFVDDAAYSHACATRGSAQLAGEMRRRVLPEASRTASKVQFQSH